MLPVMRLSACNGFRSALISETTRSPKMTTQPSSASMSACVESPRCELSRGALGGRGAGAGAGASGSGLMVPGRPGSSGRESGPLSSGTAPPVSLEQVSRAGWQLRSGEPDVALPHAVITPMMAAAATVQPVLNLCTSMGGTMPRAPSNAGGLPALSPTSAGCGLADPSRKGCAGRSRS